MTWSPFVAHYPVHVSWLLALFAQTLDDAGLSNWTLLCDMMLARFFSDQVPRCHGHFMDGVRRCTASTSLTCTIHFCIVAQRILNMVSTVEPHRRREVLHIPTLEEIAIEVKEKNVPVKVVKAHSTLADFDFMKAFQRMVSSMLFVYLIYWIVCSSTKNFPALWSLTGGVWHPCWQGLSYLVARLATQKLCKHGRIGPL